MLVISIKYQVVGSKEGMEKIQSFTDLIAWKEAHQLVLTIYRVTKNFPKEETYSLTDQIRRAVVSITSNISEGFSRQGVKEKIQFYYMALGSLTEVQNQLLIARDLNYLKKEDFRILSELTIKVSKLINGLIKSLKNIYA